MKWLISKLSEGEQILLDTWVSDKLKNCFLMSDGKEFTITYDGGEICHRCILKVFDEYNRLELESV